MKNQNHENLQSQIEKRAARRQKKQKPAMKVSGAGVKQLQKIIKGKGNK